MKNADAAQVAAVYRHFYPLFQQAYVDLGYPDGYFNDRLVEVIDHLLATPDVAGPIKLTQPGVFYQYADPSIEERSAGQKLMIRLGSENAAIVKEKLRALRKEVTKQSAADKQLAVVQRKRFGEVPSCTSSHWCSRSPRSAREQSRCIWFASCSVERENAQTLQARVTELEQQRAATGSGRDIRRGADAADGFAVHRRAEQSAPRQRPEPQAARAVAGNAARVDHRGRRPCAAARPGAACASR